jgi:uncharacterized membrane protein
MSPFIDNISGFTPTNWIEVAVSTTAFASLIGYHVWLVRTYRREPARTALGIAHAVRERWVRTVMTERRDILAVQTLRNWTMAATFLASTAMLIALGLLNVAMTTPRLAEMSHLLNAVGSRSESLWMVKLTLLTLLCFAIFLNFALAVRYYNHAAFLLTLSDDGDGAIELATLAVHRGAVQYHIGMRGYYVTIPLALWLLGPLWFLGSVIGLIFLMRRMDRTL